MFCSPFGHACCRVSSQPHMPQWLQGVCWAGATSAHLPQTQVFMKEATELCADHPTTRHQPSLPSSPFLPLRLP